MIFFMKLRRQIWLLCSPTRIALREACAIWMKGLHARSVVPTVWGGEMEQTEALAYARIHSSLKDLAKVALRLAWAWLDDAKVPVAAWSNSLGGRLSCQMFLMLASLGQLRFCSQSGGLEVPKVSNCLHCQTLPWRSPSCSLLGRTCLHVGFVHFCLPLACGWASCFWGPTDRCSHLEWHLAMQWGSEG